MEVFNELMFLSEIYFICPEEVDVVQYGFISAKAT